MSYNVQVLSKNSCQLGEGPHWDGVNQRLLFIDIEKAAIHRWNYATSLLSEPIVLEDPTIGAVVPRQKGGLVAAASHRFASINEETGKIDTLVKVTDNANCRFNDGKCDPRGRFWAGTMGLETKPAEPMPKQGELFTLDTDLSFKKRLSGIDISNGLAWTQDGSRMFYIDSLKYDVTAYKYDLNTGDISDPLKVVEFDRETDGVPDGQCIDSDGNLWIAMFFVGCVLKVDTTTGKIAEKIEISKTAIKTTSCCFGGPNLDELFVTSAINKQLEMDRGHVLGDSGSLFKVTGLGVKGLPAMPFKG